MIRLHRGYALATLLLLMVEAAIAIWLHDPLVRPYGGDALAVILVYCGLRATTRLGVRAAAFTAFAVACAIELSQRFHLVDAIGLGGSPIARAILGTGFDPRDFLAYAAGAALILLGEARIRRSIQPSVCSRKGAMARWREEDLWAAAHLNVRRSMIQSAMTSPRPVRAEPFVKLRINFGAWRRSRSTGHRRTARNLPFDFAQGER